MAASKAERLVVCSVDDSVGKKDVHSVGLSAAGWVTATVALLKA